MSKLEPKSGDTFYRINDRFEVISDEYLPQYSKDQALVEAGNCFRTYDEAAEVAEKFKSIVKDYQITEKRPKLTIEVFDREDCPDWARYAAVDYDGNTYYYDVEPELKNGVWCIGHKRARAEFITGGYDNSDYKHSLVRRPEKIVLPDWVKPDAIGWHAIAGYYTISTIEKTAGDLKVNFKSVVDNRGGYFYMPTLTEECREARCIVDAVDLVGKKVRCSGGAIRLITRCDPSTNRVDIGGLTGIPIGRLTESQNYQLIGEVKFKYQHREKDAWVD